MATPHAVLPHALEQITPHAPTGHSRPGSRGWLRSGVLLGATTALTLTVLPGTAAAVPGESTDPAQAAQFVADASRRLEIVSEQVNEAQDELTQKRAAVAAAEQSAADAQSRLDALDGQIRQLARTAYTSDGLTQMDVLLTSDSAEDFVSQLGTLDAIAGHTNDLAEEVSTAAEQARSSRAGAEEAAAQAQRALDDMAAQQKDLESQVARYQRQYEALTAPQREEVARTVGGEAQTPPSGVVAPSAAAQTAVDTALAQVGDPYVWGASGPDAFDCSGLTLFSYAAAGVKLPRASRAQATAGLPVSVSELQPGDLLFFYSPISHEAMYVGDGMMVHASTSGTPVKVVPLASMVGDFTTARRVAG